MPFQANAFQGNAFEGAAGGAPPEIDPSRQRLFVGVGRAVIPWLFLEWLLKLWREIS